MNILLPLSNEAGIIVKANLGFQPINPTYGLTELSGKVADPGLQDGAAVIVNAGETAIPDVCAHVQYLRTKLSEPHLDMEDEAVKAWMGVLAVIALSERRGFKLSVDTVDLNAGKQEYLKQVYLEALAKEHLLDAQNRIRVLKMNNNPIAVLDQPVKGANGRYRCMCYPFSTIDNDGAAMYPVKWFAPGWIDRTKNKRVAHRWNNVCGLDQNNHNLPYLDANDRIIFAEWLNALKGKGTVPNSSSVDYDKAVDSVIYALHTDVIDSNGKLILVEDTIGGTNRPENLTAWRGALACVALSKLRGCSVTLEHYKPRTLKPEDDVRRHVLLRSEGQNSFVLVVINGARIGRLDSNLLIRPFYCLDDSLENVPWYFNNKWQDIDGVAVSFDIMNKAERKRLAMWYKNLAQTHPDADVANALRISAQLIEQAFGAATAIGNTTPVDALVSAHFPDGTLIPSEFGAIMKKISAVPDLANPLPPDYAIFADRLILTMRGEFNGQSELGILPTDGTKSINNEVRLKDDSDPLSVKTERHLALLPLRASFTQRFTNDPGGIDLLDLTMSQDGDDVVVKITLNNGGVPINRQHEYSISRGEVLYFSMFPYLAMWPYINADSWNEYQVVWSDKDASFVPSNILPSADGTLTPMHPYEVTSTFDNDVNNQWNIMQYKSFPEYVHFQVIDGGTPLEVGSIYVAPPAYHTTKGNTCYAAIDFGSSNTIVRLADVTGKIINESANQPYRVFTNSYVKPLTKCADEMPGYYDRIRSFHEFHWLPFEGMGRTGADFWKPNLNKRTDKLPTVVELYKDAGLNNNKAPRYGQFLMSNCNVMSYFLGEATRKGTELSQLGICSNIKMKQTVTPGNLYDGQIALQMILLNCALAAIEKNASLSFVVSYPDNRMWMDLNKYWTPAANAAKETCSSINYNGQISLKTTELWSAHYFASQFVKMVNPQVGYCIIDIGGGTTDISLWKSNSAAPGAKEMFCGGLSLKYAGNQITSETVFSFYRRLCGIPGANFEDFRMLWDLQKVPDTIRVYETRMEEGFRDFINMNFAVAENVRRIHQEVPLLSTTIVSDCSFSDRVKLGFANVQPFAALLRLKVINVFYVVAQFLNMTNAFDRDNNLGTKYVFSLAGNGAAAFDACDEDKIREFVCYMTNTITQSPRSFDVQNLPDYRKTEVVNGMCALIQEKLAVGALTGGALREPTGYVVTDAMFPKSNWGQVTQDMWAQIPQDTYRSYCEYVEYLLNPEAGLIPVDHDFLAVDGGESIYSMLTMNDPENQQLFNNNYSDIITQVVEECGSSTPLAMVPHIAAIKMIDHILLVHKYK